ncbi:SdpI family protein [Thermodesulfobacteriota bacterium]
MRFKKSYESDENWYKINKYGGRQLIIWSIPLGLFGIVTFFLPISESPLLFLISVLAPLIVLIPVFISYVYARKL